MGDDKPPRERSLPFDGAWMRTPVSRPPQPAQVAGGMPMTELPHLEPR